MSRTLSLHILRRMMLGACVTLSACRTLPNIEKDAIPAGAQRSLPVNDLAAEVDALARPLVAHGETPGLVVGILLPDGTKRFFGYGATDDVGSVPDGDTLFAIGSVSKEFLGVMAAVLVGEGRLAWSDTLGQLLPQTSLSADAKKITLLQLATHTSGLPNQPMTFRTGRYFLDYLFTGKNFYRHLTAEYVFKYLTKFKVPRHPVYRYSNLGYALLGEVLERRAGQSLDVLLSRILSQPLGLKYTGYRPELLPGYTARARGHAGDEPKFVTRGKHVPDWSFTEFMKGTGGLYSTACDLLTFAAAYLHPVSPALDAALAETRRVPIAWFTDDAGGGSILLYQTGIVGGFSSYLGIDPERRTAVVVLANSFHWRDKVGHRLLLRLRG